MKEEKVKTTISKNLTAKIETKSGNQYSYKYVDIAQIHEYLEKNNMSYYQYIERIDNDDYIMTVKIKDGVEKPALRGSRVVDATLMGNTNPAQIQGSALTYARRYSLLMAFGLATEDDDAQGLTMPSISSKEEAENYVLTFGKHANKKLKEVPKSYIHWLLENSKDEAVKTACDYLVENLTKEDQKEKLDLMVELTKLVDETDTDYDELLKYYKVNSNGDMSLEQLKDAVAVLEMKKNKNKEEVF